MGRILIETPPGQVSYYTAEIERTGIFLEKSKEAFAEIEEEEKNGKSKDAFASPRAASSCVHPRGILVLGVCQVNYQNCRKTESNLN